METCAVSGDLRQAAGHAVEVARDRVQDAEVLYACGQLTLSELVTAEDRLEAALAARHEAWKYVYPDDSID